MSSVATVRDFGLIFDALSHFEESLLAAKMAAAGAGLHTPSGLSLPLLNTVQRLTAAVCCSSASAILAVILEKVVQQLVERRRILLTNLHE